MYKGIWYSTCINNLNRKRGIFLNQTSRTTLQAQLKVIGVFVTIGVEHMTAII